MRVSKTYHVGSVSFIMMFNPDLSEYKIVVKDNNRIIEGRCYYTDCRIDAQRTMEHMIMEERNNAKTEKENR